MTPHRVTSPFIKSSYSGGASNDCVEVARTSDGGRAVRDSKNPGMGTQFYAPHAWDSFISGLRTGEFAH
ncbi:DUF397 domain-containing protein [Streptomyces xinghaiensis]|uniref:DUF397 domain-containing protein n=1 Tax=Streptomyces xinghaiensis TaxID=1038928 RepID=UPI000BAFC200|nr:DUF397 domain-containing protein [Streptomyces xinghaiensis]MZE77622.1 DUF397 domain-containing protein [Streptomyces sp. SID5475]